LAASGAYENMSKELTILSYMHNDHKNHILVKMYAVFASRGK